LQRQNWGFFGRGRKRQRGVGHNRPALGERKDGKGKAQPKWGKQGPDNDWVRRKRKKTKKGEKKMTS